MNDWTDVADAVKAVGGHPAYAIERARQSGTSPELVLEGVRRALDFEGYGDFEDWEATPPGCIDTRVFMQSTWWVDVLRRPHRIVEMPREYRHNVIEFLRRDAEYFYERYRTGHPVIEYRNANDWLDGTPLMQALSPDAIPSTR